MTENFDSSTPKDLAEKLDKEALLAAATALCVADRGAELLLRTVFKRLATNTKNWSKQAKRFDRYGLSARHVTGPLRDALNLPGDLVLLQVTESSFILLHRLE